MPGITVNVNTENYSTTILRDSDIRLNSSSFYPNITYISGLNGEFENPVGSVRINTSGIAYVDNVIVDDEKFSEEFKPKVELYDLVVGYMSGKRKKIEVTTPQNLTNDDEVLGICVIPQGLIDEEPRFVAVKDLGEGCFGYLDGSRCSSPIELTKFFLIATEDADPHVFAGSGTPFAIYFCTSENNISYFYTLPNSGNSINGFDHIYNVIPIINTSTQNSNLHPDTKRVVQFTAIAASDNIVTGKKSSYIDCGYNNSSYFYYLGGDYSNYAQPSWKLNGTLNLNSTIGFYKDENGDYPSFLNPLSKFDGYDKTATNIKTTVFNNYYIDECRENFNFTLYSSFNDNNAFVKLFSSTFSTYLPIWNGGILPTTEDYTAGTIKQGNLYIPSLGEFSFLISRLKVINDLIEEYNGDKIDNTYIYMTSTECSYTGVYAVWPFNGSMMNIYKSQNLMIRPFIKFNNYKKRV
jgi:hypothetical protein